MLKHCIIPLETTRLIFTNLHYSELLSANIYRECQAVYNSHKLFLHNNHSACVYLCLLIAFLQPIPVAEQSKARVCGRQLAGIAGSNPSGGIDICLL